MTEEPDRMTQDTDRRVMPEFKNSEWTITMNKTSYRSPEIAAETFETLGDRSARFALEHLVAQSLIEQLTESRQAADSVTLDVVKVELVTRVRQARSGQDVEAGVLALH